MLAEDLIKFDRRVEEQNLLLDNNLYSQEDIVNYANACEQELDETNEANMSNISQFFNHRNIQGGDGK